MESHHAVVFPFMAKGHTIPLLHLVRLLLLRPGLTVTVFTTPGNRHFVAKSLSDTSASILALPFPQDVPGVPAGVESTDKLPSMALHTRFSRATRLMQPNFERQLEKLPRVSFMISDAFLGWTLESAEKFGIPRFAFYGINFYSSCLYKAVGDNLALAESKPNDESFRLPEFPWIEVTTSLFSQTIFQAAQPPFSLEVEFLMDHLVTTARSRGLIVNSFYELEPVFVDYYTHKQSPKPWCVGPLCLADRRFRERDFHQNQRDPSSKPWIQWLDKKLEQGKSVLYVSFGSQADVSKEQLLEIAWGLQESKVNFLWVLARNQEIEIETPGLGDDRGLIVREWVDQLEILAHQSVQGFLSHCGWNSVLESICAGVPVLGWPMMAEQPLNAKMVEEEIKVGLRLKGCDGFVGWREVETKVRELMEGDEGKEARKAATAYGESARMAMEEGRGSSWSSLDKLINDVCRSNEEKT